MVLLADQPGRRLVAPVPSPWRRGAGASRCRGSRSRSARAPLYERRRTERSPERPRPLVSPVTTPLPNPRRAGRRTRRSGSTSPAAGRRCPSRCSGSGLASMSMSSSVRSSSERSLGTCIPAAASRTASTTRTRPYGRTYHGHDETHPTPFAAGVRRRPIPLDTLAGCPRSTTSPATRPASRARTWSGCTSSSPTGRSWPTSRSPISCSGCLTQRQRESGRARRSGPRPA